jgi:carbon-monoxide dehydrogenase medium subunit
LLALDAKAEVASEGSRCLLPLQDLFRGPGKSALDLRREILVGFHLPLRRPYQASAFQRVMRPQGVAIAILNLAVWVQREHDRIADVRISIGPAGPTPLRARLAEAELRGEAPGKAVFEQAVEALLGEARFRTSPHRATEAYRKKMAKVLLEETFVKAWQRIE